MVGETVSAPYNLGEVLNEKQILHIVKESVGDDVEWQSVESEVRPAVDGIAGFLGDHMRATLRVKVGGKAAKLQLFIKRLPTANKPKADFIDRCNFFRKEVFAYKLLGETVPDSDPAPYYSKVFLHTETMVVMPDLAAAGYASRNHLETLDVAHARLAAKSIARFHAAYTNYETKKAIKLNRPYSLYEEHADLLNEPTFCDSPWLKACSKLTVNFLNAFSTKFNRNIPDLESKLDKLNLEACESLKEVPGTLNVLIHKDFWMNNILFKYEGDVPVNALLIDFQCVRYGPPSFDLMLFLYLTTSRSFRERHEREVFREYYKIFNENLDKDSKARLSAIGYDEAEFLAWCERSRMFGLFEALSIFPFVLMEPVTAQRHFDDPDTYDLLMNVDRSGPVLDHAGQNTEYRVRQLEVCEEFIERYVVHSV